MTRGRRAALSQLQWRASCSTGRDRKRKSACSPTLRQAQGRPEQRRSASDEKENAKRKPRWKLEAGSWRQITMAPHDLTRRELLALAGSAAAAGLLGCGSAAAGSTTSSPTSPTPTAGSCVMTPQLTEGPYFVDERLNRSDIRVDPSTGVVSAGVPLTLNVRVSQIAGGACSALAGAFVDIWHCDAGGVHSDEAAMNSTGKRFLR